MEKDLFDYHYDGENNLYFLKHEIKTPFVKIYEYPSSEDSAPEINEITLNNPVTYSFFLDNYIVNYSTSFAQIIEMNNSNKENPFKTVYEYFPEKNSEIFYIYSFDGKIRFLLESSEIIPQDKSTQPPAWKRDLKLLEIQPGFKKVKLIKSFSDVNIDLIRKHKIIQLNEEKFMLANTAREKNLYYITFDFKFYEDLGIEPFSGMNYLYVKNYWLDSELLHLIFIGSDNNLGYPEMFLGSISGDDSMTFFPISFYSKASYYKLKIFNGFYSILSADPRGLQIINFPVNWKTIDTDKDGFSDFEEFRLGINYKEPDSDFDGYLDIEDTISSSGNKRIPVFNRILSKELGTLVENEKQSIARVIIKTNYKLSAEYFAKIWVQQFYPEEFNVWKYSVYSIESEKEILIPEFTFKFGLLHSVIFLMKEDKKINIYLNLFGKPLLISRQ